MSQLLRHFFSRIPQGQLQKGEPGKANGKQKQRALWALHWLGFCHHLAKQKTWRPLSNAAKFSLKEKQNKTKAGRLLRRWTPLESLSLLSRFLNHTVKDLSQQAPKTGLPQGAERTVLRSREKQRNVDWSFDSASCSASLCCHVLRHTCLNAPYSLLNKNSPVQQQQSYKAKRKKKTGCNLEGALL